MVLSWGCDYKNWIYRSRMDVNVLWRNVVCDESWYLVIVLLRRRIFLFLDESQVRVCNILCNKVVFECSTVSKGGWPFFEVVRLTFKVFDIFINWLSVNDWFLRFILFFWRLWRWRSILVIFLWWIWRDTWTIFLRRNLLYSFIILLVCIGQCTGILLLYFYVGEEKQEKKCDSNHDYKDQKFASFALSVLRKLSRLWDRSLGDTDISLWLFNFLPLIVFNLKIGHNLINIINIISSNHFVISFQCYRNICPILSET